MSNAGRHFEGQRRSHHDGGLTGMQDPHLEIGPGHPLWPEFVRTMLPDLSDEELEQVSAVTFEVPPDTED